MANELVIGYEAQRNLLDDFLAFPVYSGNIWIRLWQGGSLGSDSLAVTLADCVAAEAAYTGYQPNYAAAPLATSDTTTQRTTAGPCLAVFPSDPVTDVTISGAFAVSSDSTQLLGHCSFNPPLVLIGAGDGAAISLRFRVAQEAVPQNNPGWGFFFDVADGAPVPAYTDLNLYLTHLDVYALNADGSVNTTYNGSVSINLAPGTGNESPGIGGVLGALLPISAGIGSTDSFAMQYTSPVSPHDTTVTITDGIVASAAKLYVNDAS